MMWLAQLIDMGVPLQYHGESSLTPLHRAAQTGNLPAVNILGNAIRTGGLNINLESNTGLTAWDMAGSHTGSSQVVLGNLGGKAGSGAAARAAVARNRPPAWWAHQPAKAAGKAAGPAAGHAQMQNMRPGLVPPPAVGLGPAPPLPAAVFVPVQAAGFLPPPAVGFGPAAPLPAAGIAPLLATGLAPPSTVGLGPAAPLPAAGMAPQMAVGLAPQPAVGLGPAAPPPPPPPAVDPAPGPPALTVLAAMVAQELAAGAPAGVQQAAAAPPANAGRQQAFIMHETVVTVETYTERQNQIPKQ